MTTAVVGAGPVGLLCAAALAGRGEQVVLLDRDTGPAPDGSWRRRGVMQFSHPHFFRHLVRQALEEHAPALWDAVVAAGCVVNDPPEGIPPTFTTLATRRSTFEAALRGALPADRVRHVGSHAERIVVRGGRVTGVVAGGTTHDVDRVLVATGRASRLGDDLRPPGVSIPCGQSYVSRTYRVRPGVEAFVSWRPLRVEHAGYHAYVFPQDAGTHSALVLRRSHDAAWEPLWRNECFDAVAATVPVLALWTDPERVEPLTDVVRGGTLHNGYRAQGAPPAGAFFVGDAVCTTNPSAGRGVGLGFLQVSALLALLDEHADLGDASAAFDAWCERHVRPWFDDHVAVDASTVRALTGQPPDPEGTISSDLVVAASTSDPVLQGLVAPYLGMATLPASLVPGQDRVRALLRSGWRPQPEPGPSRDDLVELMAEVSARSPALSPA